MAWSKVGESTFTLAAGSGSETKSLPGTLAQGDIVFVAMSCDTMATSSATWNRFVTTGYTGPPYATGSSPGHQVAYKIMGPTPDTSVELLQSAVGLPIAGLIQVWRGVDTGTPEDATFTSASSSSGDPNPPSLTTVTDGALRLIFGFLDDDDAAGSASAPSGYTDFLAADTGQASTSLGATVMVASKIATTAGAEDPGAFSTPGDDAWYGYHFALRPAAGDPDPVEGDLAATDGADLLLSSGDVLVQASMAATDGADAASMSGVVLDDIDGDLAVTDGADTAAFAGGPVVQGDLAATEGSDAATLAGKVITDGTLAATEGADTSAVSGSVLVSGDLAATEGADLSTFAAKLIVSGDLAATEGADLSVMTGRPLAQGDLVAVEGADAAAIAGGVVVLGTMTATDGADTFASDGEVYFVPATGDLAAVEGSDASAMTGRVPVDGALAATEGADSAAFDGNLLDDVEGDFALAEGADFLAIAGAVRDRSQWVIQWA